MRSLEGSKCGPSHLAALSFGGGDHPRIIATIQNFSRLSRTPFPPVMVAGNLLSNVHIIPAHDAPERAWDAYLVQPHWFRCGQSALAWRLTFAPEAYGLAGA
jgi:hypothetical protein